MSLSGRDVAGLDVAGLGIEGPNSSATGAIIFAE